MDPEAAEHRRLVPGLPRLRGAPGRPLTQAGPASGEAGYVELIRGNRAFRRLWLATVISLFGDWFNTIAIYTLVERLTDSPFAIGLVFVIKLAGFAVASPPSGILADRVSRKGLMIGTDLARAAIVPLFLLVDSAGEVPLLYVLLAAQVMLGAGFDPAFRASIPNICAPRELLTANAIFSATWSTLLALGAAIGGVATAALGTDLVFVLDAATYLVSAALVAGVHVPQPAARADGPRRGLVAAANADFKAGWRYLFAHRGVLRIALAKSLWALGGGALVYMLALVGERVTPQDVSIGIGVFFSVRGIGTGLGPILARAWFRSEATWPWVMGATVALSGVAYLALAASPVGYGVVAFVFVAHAASGANWVLSTVVLQQRVEDGFRGRVFASEMFLLTLIEAVGILAAAALLEAGAASLDAVIAGFAGLQVLSGVVWLAIVPAQEARDRRALGGSAPREVA